MKDSPATGVPEACAGSPPAEQATGLISLLAREIGRDEAARFRGAELTASQYTIAQSLAGGPLTITELAGVGCCVPANITALVDRLERHGFARRMADPADRRVTRVALTAAGDRAVTTTAAIASAHGDRLAEALPDAELRTLVNLLGRLYVELVGTGSRSLEGDPDRPAPEGSAGTCCVPDTEEPSGWAGQHAAS